MRLSQRGRPERRRPPNARGRSWPAGQDMPIDFMYGLCEPDPRVVARLRAAFNSGLRSRAFRYGPPAGDPELRQQVADRIRASRGITCSPIRS